MRANWRLYLLVNHLYKSLSVPYNTDALVICFAAGCLIQWIIRWNVLDNRGYYATGLMPPVPDAPAVSTTRASYRPECAHLDQSGSDGSATLILVSWFSSHQPPRPVDGKAIFGALMQATENPTGCQHRYRVRDLAWGLQDYRFISQVMLIFTTAVLILAIYGYRRWLMKSILLYSKWNAFPHHGAFLHAGSLWWGNYGCIAISSVILWAYWCFQV